MDNILKFFTDSRRWSNPATYLSLLATLPALFALFHVSFLTADWASFETATKSLITVLVELGILMNPNSKGYSDKLGG